MPKPGKTNRSMKKRFKVTGSGKIKHYRSMHSHYMMKKSKRRKRALRTPAVLTSREATHIRRGLLLGLKG